MTIHSPTWQIHPAGDRSLVVVFEGNDLATQNQHASQLARYLHTHKPHGVHTIVPGMVTVALHFAPDQVWLHALANHTSTPLSPYHWLAQQLTPLINQAAPAQTLTPREIDIPVCYGGDYGPDLQEVADLCKLTPQEVIALHTAHPVQVFMLGFAPGHPYIGRFNEQLVVSRRSSPRTSVPAGTIGLANQQSVIYPMQLPGGWHLIGRTPLVMFDANRDQPSLLQAGDRVRFIEIDSKTFDEMAVENAS